MGDVLPNLRKADIWIDGMYWVYTNTNCYANKEHNYWCEIKRAIKISNFESVRGKPKTMYSNNMSQDVLKESPSYDFAYT